jgi:hypothetical protein
MTLVVLRVWGALRSLSVTTAGTALNDLGLGVAGRGLPDTAHSFFSLRVCSEFEHVKSDC